MDLKPSFANPCLFFNKETQNKTIFVFLYVDDMAITGHFDAILHFKTQISSQFKISDLGPIEYILGMQIPQDRINQLLYLNQHIFDVYPALVQELLAKYSVAQFVIFASTLVILENLCLNYLRSRVLRCLWRCFGTRGCFEVGVRHLSE